MGCQKFDLLAEKAAKGHSAPVGNYHGFFQKLSIETQRYVLFALTS